MDNFFYTMNFTVSNLLLYGFLLLYSHICVGKPRKGWALATGLIILLIDLIFAIIPWVLYEDASCWIIQTHRNGFTALHWCIFLLFFLISHKKHLHIFCLVCGGIFLNMHYTRASACSRSAMISFTFSIPTERRIRSGATPASFNCSSFI